MKEGEDKTFSKITPKERNFGWTPPKPPQIIIAYFERYISTSYSGKKLPFQIRRRLVCDCVYYINANLVLKTTQRDLGARLLIPGPELTVTRIRKAYFGRNRWLSEQIHNKSNVIRETWLRPSSWPWAPGTGSDPHSDKDPISSLW